MVVKKTNKLLGQFLGDNILVFISGLDSDVQTEDGPMSVPMINQGFLVDYDEQFILLSDENSGGFTLININNISKIDTIQETQHEEVGKPPKEGMN